MKKEIVSNGELGSQVWFVEIITREPLSNKRTAVVCHGNLVVGKLGDKCTIQVPTFFSHRLVFTIAYSCRSEAIRHLADKIKECPEYCHYADFGNDY